MLDHSNSDNDHENRLVMVYCHNIDGHRQIHCEVIAQFFLDNGFFVILVVGKQVGNANREDGDSYPYFDHLRLHHRVHIEEIPKDLSPCSAGAEIQMITEIQKRYQVDWTYFIDADDLLSAIWSCRSLWKPHWFGKVCGTFYNKQGITHPWRVEYHPANELLRNLLGRLKLQLKLALFYRVILRKFFNFDKCFFPDEKFLKKFSYKRYQYLPEIYKSFSSDVKRDDDFFISFIKKYRSFLNANKGKDVILCFGAATRRKGYDYLLKLVSNHQDFVFVHCGRHVIGQKYDFDVDQYINNLRSSARIFEMTGLFVSDDRVITELFSSTKYYLLPYRRHYFSSGIFFQALEYRKPILVPDVGLLCTYVQDHEIGLTFKHLSYEDFEKQVLALQKTKGYFDDNVARFSQMFTKNEIYAHLEEGLGIA